MPLKKPSFTLQRFALQWRDLSSGGPSLGFETFAFDWIKQRRTSTPNGTLRALPKGLTIRDSSSARVSTILGI